MWPLSTFKVPFDVVPFKRLLILLLPYSSFHCSRCNSTDDIWQATKYNLATTDYHCTQLRLSWPHDSYLQLRHSTCIWLISAVCGRCGRTKSVITSCAFYAVDSVFSESVECPKVFRDRESISECANIFLHFPSSSKSEAFQIHRNRIWCKTLLTIVIEPKVDSSQLTTDNSFESVFWSENNSLWWVTKSYPKSCCGRKLWLLWFNFSSQSGNLCPAPHLGQTFLSLICIIQNYISVLPLFISVYWDLK